MYGERLGDGVEYHLMSLRPVVKYHLRRGVGLIKFLKMVLDPSPPPLISFTCETWRNQGTQCLINRHIKAHSTLSIIKTHSASALSSVMCLDDSECAVCLSVPVDDSECALMIRLDDSECALMCV